MSAPLHHCPICGNPLMRQGKKYCSDRCRKDGHKQAKNTLSGTLHQTGQKSPKPAAQAIEIIEAARRKIRNSEIGPLRFVRINEVTLKLTDDVMTRTSGSHGQWAGYDAPRALAWVYDIGWTGERSAWMVSYQNSTYGPTTLAKAKAAAVALVQGGFEEPVDVPTDPIRRLNVMQSALVDGDRRFA